LPPEHRSDLPRKAERWFDRARAALLGALPCRPGCCRCCIGPFPITIRDARHLRQGLQTLPPDARRDIEARARGQASAMEAAFPALAASPFLDDWSDADQDALMVRFADRPCPALGDDGRCRVYAFRPLTCRLMGIPPEAGGLVQGACEVQTFVPIVRLSRALRAEEDALTVEEAAVLDGTEEELPITHGFLPGGAWDETAPSRP
jgi:Fe-S-cluster containining protein